MFALEVEYLLGRSFAADFRDSSEPEWPPHPSRLYSTLASAYFEAGAVRPERAALEWLEQQPAPHIRAGQPGKPSKTTAYVPTNYPGAGLPAARLKQPRSFAAQAPSDATAYFVWPDATPDEQVRTALDRLASRSACLGKACSLVRICVVNRTPEPNFVPDPFGSRVLRVPNPGRLEELKLLFEAGRRPSIGAQARYTDLNLQPLRNGPIASEFGRILTFRKLGGPGLPIDASLTLTDAVREALMSVAGSDGAIADLIHGHNLRHCAYIPLPFTARKHADGHLMGFGIVLPRDVTSSERAAVLRACGRLHQRGLHIVNIGDWTIEPADPADLRHTLRAGTWTRPSRVWSTVTPILLDRFPKRDGRGVEEILHSACVRIGLPRPSGVEHSISSSVPGVPPVPQFRLRRHSNDPPRWGVHATFTFPIDVEGPVLLGAGRYFGLGLLRPIHDAEAGEDE